MSNYSAPVSFPLVTPAKSFPVVFSVTFASAPSTAARVKCERSAVRIPPNPNPSPHPNLKRASDLILRSRSFGR